MGHELEDKDKEAMNIVRPSFKRIQKSSSAPFSQRLLKILGFNLFFVALYRKVLFKMIHQQSSLKEKSFDVIHIVSNPSIENYEAHSPFLSSLIEEHHSFSVQNY